jgi:hypothetical protein
MTEHQPNLDSSFNNEPKIIAYPPQTPTQRLMWEIFFLFPILVGVFFFGKAASMDVKYTWYLTIIFGINLIFRFVLVNQKGDWFFYIFGVIAGGGNDLLSMINGVYNYTSVTIIPALNGLMPLWMILFWGQVILLFRKIFAIPALRGVKFTKSGKFFGGWADKALIFDCFLLISLRAVIYHFYLANPWIPAAIYFIGIMIRFILFPPKRNQWLIIATLPYAYVFEGLLVEFGLYEYYYPAFLGMPGWLFLWWVFLVPIFVKELFDRFEYIIENKFK